ncbi:MAG: FAD-binding oxidoreductase [Acidobacteriota bacterium]
MADLQIKTRSGETRSLPPEAINSLAAGFGGRLLHPLSADYDAARSVWNAMIDRRPALIAQCHTAADVVAAVRFATHHALLVSVRGGGHNIAGNAVCDGGLMIDLSGMTQVDGDPTSRTARVGPGATLADLDRATQAHALATPVGINSTTGIAGLTLGGGFGWLSRSLGLTIDNLLSVEIVTASGTLVTASATEHADLFWAIRGGGGNFGVVTSFQFRLHPIGPDVLAGMVIHPLDAAGNVLRFYREFIKTTPDDFVCWFVLRQAPPLPFLASEWHGKPILVLAMCYAGPVADGEKVAHPLRSFGRPIADVVGVTPFTAWQTVLDPLLTPGMRNYWKSHDFLALPDGLINVLTDHAGRIPDPQTEIAVAQLGGAVSRVPADATAYTHRDAQFVMNVHGRWADPSKDAACIDWARLLFQAAAPFATGGVYVNFLTQEEQGRVKAAYGSNYDRLAALKKKYDPDNVFRVNQNITPAA